MDTKGRIGARPHSGDRDMQFEGFLVFATEKAILFHGHYWEDPMWLPKSQVKMTAEDNDTTEEATVVLSDWIARENKLREFEYRGKNA